MNLSKSVQQSHPGLLRLNQAKQILTSIPKLTYVNNLSFRSLISITNLKAIHCVNHCRHYISRFLVQTRRQGNHGGGGKDLKLARNLCDFKTVHPEKNVNFSVPVIFKGYNTASSYTPGRAGVLSSLVSLCSAQGTDTVPVMAAEFLPQHPVCTLFQALRSCRLAIFFLSNWSDPLCRKQENKIFIRTRSTVVAFRGKLGKRY